MPPGHLRRLDQVWIENPDYFVTACAAQRRAQFADPAIFSVLQRQLTRMNETSGWRVGRFVVMPDHVHFFCACGPDAPPLSRAVGALKQWSAKALVRGFGAKAPVWQREFFDHVLRSPQSYESKWRYVLENPVRAGLVKQAGDWPYAGEIAELEGGL